MIITGMVLINVIRNTAGMRDGVSKFPELHLLFKSFRATDEKYLQWQCKSYDPDGVSFLHLFFSKNLLLYCVQTKTTINNKHVQIARIITISSTESSSLDISQWLYFYCEGGH